MLCPLTWGVRTVFLDTVSFVKHPRRWMKACSDFDGTLTFAPNFAYALAARRTKPRHIEELDLSSLRVIGCGAEPNHPATLRRFVDHFAPAGLEPNALLPVYGMAEATLAMTFSRLDDEVRVDRVEPDPYTEDGHARSLDGWPREMTIDAHDEGSESPSPDATSNAADASNGDDASAETHYLEYVTCGRPFPEHEILIVDDDGNELPERSVGEIVFRGPSVTAGYYRDGAATAAAYTDKGLHTGDLGYLVDGELFVTGRKKDVVILNGRNYDPQTIEWLVARGGPEGQRRRLLRAGHEDRAPGRRRRGQVGRRSRRHRRRGPQARAGRALPPHRRHRARRPRGAAQDHERQAPAIPHPGPVRRW